MERNRYIEYVRNVRDSLSRSKERHKDFSEVLSEIQARLGTPEEKPSDFVRCRELAHKIISVNAAIKNAEELLERHAKG